MLEDHFSRFAKRSSRVADVVHDDTFLAGHITDHGHFRNLSRLLATFVHDRQWSVDPLRQLTRARHTAHVRRDDHDVVHIALELMHDVQGKDWRRIEVVHRNIKEALDLRGVQVHGQNPLDTGFDQHIGDQFCRDRRPRLGATILTGVAKVGDHSGDALG